MNTLRLLFAAGFTLAATQASCLAQTSVWKITKGGATVYLGGTCHVLRASDFPLPTEFDVAFDASSKLFFETDLARLQSAEMQEIVMKRGFFTDGTTLKSVLTPEAWAQVSGYATRAGLPLAQVMRMRPWFFTVMITMLELQKIGVSAEGVDAHYFKKAAVAGKATGELESFEDHVNFLVNLGAGHESEMISNSITELEELPEQIGKLLAAWKSGDLPQLDEHLLKEMREKYPAIFQALLVDRNRNWQPTIERLFTTPETEFVLVGAGHLAGAEGLIAVLKQNGYTVQQLQAAPAKN
jgi:uncharacterized protein YbaP (TraB family)